MHPTRQRVIYLPAGDDDIAHLAVIELHEHTDIWGMRGLIKRYFPNADEIMPINLPSGTMYVDALATPKGLPRNEQATRRYRADWLSTHRGCDPETLPAICGPAVVVQPAH
jgi:hypothetical protein